MIPNSRPQMKRSDVEKCLQAKGIMFKNQVVVLAVRGYYLDSMGLPGKNDRGLYDDAVFVVTPEKFISCNWNTDPTKILRGSGTGAGKGMASLMLGVWSYQIGLHRGKGPACVQAAPVKVTRDGLQTDYVDSGWFGINHHPGGNTVTGSEGCQTAPPTQWLDYIKTVESEMKRLGQKTFKYVLIDEEDRRYIVGALK